jgi:eukaryotic-like serine/threonine-protein kinase
VIQCPKCNQMLDGAARFCPNDGTPLTETSAQNTVPTPSGGRPKSVEIDLPVVVGGRYRLEEKRGGGGMAKVYRAVDVTLEREVAVKLINQKLRKEEEFDVRFHREARIASQLADPHIVVVHDYGIDPQYGPFLVMEYLKGESLRERLHGAGILPYKAGLQLSAQLLLALIHAHDKNIVHRDIKPDNVFLLNQSGVRLHLRVLDFGIARIYRRDDPNRAETLTHPGAVLGTPRYMSPEQLAGQPLDARSDIYSAAVVIHEALTGQLPYLGGKKLRELCPEATVPMQELLDQCLKPSPQERPESALEVYLRLQELGKASGVLLLPPGALEKLAASRLKGAEDPRPPEPATTQALAPRPGSLPKGPLRLLAALAIGMALMGAVILIRMLFWPPAPSVAPGPESLLGVKIGDPEQDVVDNLNKEDSLVHMGLIKNPWDKGPAPDYLGRVLTPELLNVSADDLQRLDVRRTKDDRLCVVFLDEKVLAVVVQRPHPGETGRGVGVSSLEPLVTARYGDRFKQEEAPAGPRAPETLIRTYKTLGVGFEIQDGKVTGVTLFPVPPEQ